MKLFEFDLTEAQEEKAKNLHEESIVIDLLFQGPLAPTAFNDEISEKIKAEVSQHTDVKKGFMKGFLISAKLGVEEMPEFKDWWFESGLTAGNRQLGTDTMESMFASMCITAYQFDKCDWLVKALKADDIRAAKKANKKAGIVSAQDTTSLGTDLDNLDLIYDFGMRVLQLTYNTQNHVAAGCTERTNAGVTTYGVKFIERMNQLGMVVDTGHSGKQTTLDACDISSSPVIASHTAVEGVCRHARCKSDEEIEAIAKTGGVVGIVTVPQFLSNDEEPSVAHLLDHVDYVKNLVGVDHVGIGSDWPMSMPMWMMETIATGLALELGFRKEDKLPTTDTLKGFSENKEYINITRGLVSRGYSDEDIKKIIGENWLRVFDQVWK
ncbi:MAG: membrane dipeptidase [Deltaproteobacteria bacterium]|nr:membrane dipeptidase [Deltaproteobacteria bacterium]